MGLNFSKNKVKVKKSTSIDLFVFNLKLKNILIYLGVFLLFIFNPCFFLKYFFLKNLQLENLKNAIFFFKSFLQMCMYLYICIHIGNCIKSPGESITSYLLETQPLI